MASASAEQKKMVVLKSSDGEVYEVEETVAKLSRTVAQLIEELGTENVIPIYNVTGKILAKVLDYCNKQVEESPLEPDDVDAKNKETKEKNMKKWEAKYVDVDNATLILIVLAAHYLEIRGLFDLACQTTANLIKSMAVEDVRKLFNIENGYTVEEEAQVREEYPWVFEEHNPQQ